MMTKDADAQSYRERINREIGVRGFLSSKRIAASIAEYLGKEPTESSARDVVDSFCGWLYNGNDLKNKTAKLVMDITFEAGRTQHLTVFMKELGNREEYGEASRYAPEQKITKGMLDLVHALDGLHYNSCWMKYPTLMQAAQKQADSLPLEAIKLSMDHLENDFGAESSRYFSYMHYLAKALYKGEYGFKNCIATESAGIREGLFKAAIRRGNSDAGEIVSLIGKSFKKQGMTDKDIPDYVSSAPKWAQDMIDVAIST